MSYTDPCITTLSRVAPVAGHIIIVNFKTHLEKKAEILAHESFPH